MSEKMNVLMVLKDKFTKPLKGTEKEIAAAKMQIQKSSKELNKWAANANKKFKSVASTAAKTIGTLGVTLGSLAAGVGFNEAFNMETYKAQLETATGDTQKAADIMKYAINMANKTPFEGGALVEAAAKFEAMGMSAEEWLGRAGDMAGATGKDIIQATEAIIDAQSGEWERMKEFGIKGVDDMDELVQVMNSRFAGGMEKLSTTTKGMWSTVTGVAKNSLAKIVGIMDDGTVRQGSALDLLRQKISLVADTLVKWQNDGTIEAIADKATNILWKGLDFLGKSIAWVKDNANWLIPVLSGLLSAFVAFNILSTISKLWASYQTVVAGVTAAQGMLNFVMSANPIGWLTILISGLVAIGVALYKNWDTIKAAALSLWESITGVFNGIKDAIVGAFEAVKSAVSPFFDWISEKFNGLKEKLTNLPLIGGGIQKLTGWGSDDNTSGHATGTPYFRGGWTRVNEGGRGELITLPSGAKIYPADKTKQMMKSDGKKITINNLKIEVKGGDDPHETGRIIAKEFIEALQAV